MRFGGKTVNPYEVLGVAQNATLEAIRGAYKKQAVALHPDKNPKEQLEYTEKFKLASEAYLFLSDPEKRREYDLQSQQPVASPAWTTGHRERAATGAAPKTTFFRPPQRRATAAPEYEPEREPQFEDVAQSQRDTLCVKIVKDEKKAWFFQVSGASDGFENVTVPIVRLSGEGLELPDNGLIDATMFYQLLTNILLRKLMAEEIAHPDRDDSDAVRFSEIISEFMNAVTTLLDNHTLLNQLFAAGDLVNLESHLGSHIEEAGNRLRSETMQIQKAEREAAQAAHEAKEYDFVPNATQIAVFSLSDDLKKEITKLQKENITEQPWKDKHDACQKMLTDLQKADFKPMSREECLEKFYKVLKGIGKSNTKKLFERYEAVARELNKPKDEDNPAPAPAPSFHP